MQDSATTRRWRPDVAEVVIFLGALAAVAFWSSYTHHIWEDFYITYRSSRHLAMGDGLVFNVGERVHTFTSPLGTLLPALMAWLARGDDSMAILLFRCASALALGCAGVCLWRVTQGLSRTARIFAVLLLLLDSKIVDFSSNGMESAFQVWFIAATVLSLMRGPWWQLGLCWGALQWNRPDGCVYVALLAGAFLLFTPTEESRADMFKRMLRAGALAVVIYAPWFLWAFWYYGSPVPNTVRAKGYSMPLAVLIPWLLAYPVRWFRFTSAPAEAFEPSYAELGGWPSFVFQVSDAMGVLAALYWLVPRTPRLGRALSFTFLFATLYVDYAKAEPWYYPSATMLGVMVLAMALDSALKMLPRGRPLFALAATVFVVFEAWQFGAVAYQMKVKQAIIEEGQRTRIGLWLRAHARPGDTVAMECLGYIGYFSGLKTYDYPGLSAPEVVAIMPKHRDAKPVLSDINQILIHLHPTWVVLRTAEVDKMLEADDVLKRDYTPVLLFDATQQVEALGNMPGISLLQADERFFLFHRKG